MDVERVELSFRDALEIAELLEQLTVSLDRIGSRMADGQDGGPLLLAFSLDAHIARRCSRLRQPVWDAIDRLKGPGSSESFAEAVPNYPEVGGH